MGSLVRRQHPAQHGRHPQDDGDGANRHPEMAAEEERATNREAQQRSRANRADVSAVKRLARDFAALDENEKAEFMSLTGLEKCRHD